MTPTIRNRLVGSVILMAAGIIIIPSVLDGKKISYKDDFKTVPEKPQVRSVQTRKTFPVNEFDKHLPKADETVHDEVALDAQEMALNAEDVTKKSNTEIPENIPPAGTEVINTDKIAVTTMSKPVDFDNPVPPAQTKKTINKPVKKAAKKVEAPAQVKESPFTSSAWVIQLGSFGNKANAKALEKRLNAAGYVTFNRLIKTNAGTLTKVYVGPELDKNTLANALVKVNRVSGVSGIVTTFAIKR
ncbi:MAG: SPOR domain-containing protein [Psychrosphaera sp.]|nr:SPOR domain-containing protein [Psychrosphaera sp.]